MSVGGGAKAGAALGSVVPGLGTAVGGVLGGIAGGITGLFGANKQKQLEQEALANYIKSLEEQNVLSAEDYVADYEQLDPELLDFYDPVEEQAIQMGDTARAGITLDPAFKQAQMDALGALTRRGEEGLTLEEEAARNEIVNSAGVANRGAQDAIMQQAARQGRLSGGDMLNAQMNAAGGAYDRASREASDLAVQRDNRALQAVLGGGEFATSLRNQDYGEQSDTANARDTIAQFNANLSSGANQRNVAATNQAGETQASALRDVTKGNLGIRNTQADQLVQGKVSSTAAQNAKAMDIANAQRGGANKSAAQAGQAGQNIGKMIGGLTTEKNLGAIGSLFGGNDIKAKENEELTKKLQKSSIIPTSIV